MRAYVYCSYKSSPAGFQIGAISHDAAKKNFYIPSKGKFNNFVVKAFEQNFIGKMYGLLPNGGKYIFLVKNLKQSGVNDPNEGTIDFYMNFAFEFDTFGEFNSFCGNFNALTNPAAECAKFLVTDRNVETFALKIDAEKFNGFIAKMLRAGDGGQVDKKIFVEVTSAQIEESKLLETFGLEFSEDGDKKFCCPQKKTFPIIPVTVAAVAILVAIAIYFLTQ